MDATAAAVAQPTRPWAAALAWVLGSIGVGEVLGILALSASAEPAVEALPPRDPASGGDLVSASTTRRSESGGDPIS